MARIDWGTRVIMLSGGLLVSLSMVGVTVVLPQIEAALAHNARDRLLVKLLATVVGLTMVIGAPLAGFLVDRLGSKRVLVVSSILYAAAGTAGLYLDGLASLFASRLILGFTAAGIATMSMTLINTRLEGRNRAKWIGAHVSTAMIGSIALQPIIGHLAEFGWRRPFALYALSLPLALIAAVGRGGQEPARAAAGAAPASQKLTTWFPFRFLALALVIGSITFLPMVYVPFVIRDAGISSPTTISLVLVADTILGATMSMLFGRSLRYLSPHGTLLISFACSAVGMFIVALASSFAGIVCGVVIFGVSLGWAFPSLMTIAAMHVTADQQGRTTGLIKAAHYFAAPASVVLVEPVTRTFGPHGAMWVVFVLSSTGLAVFAYRIFSTSVSFQRGAPLTSDAREHT